MAGLSAAVALTQAGCRVSVIEAGPQAGGRCRSYEDREIGCVVDNGNHLLLSGNSASMRYIDLIGARGTLGGPGVAFFPFMDLRDGRRWILRPNAGRIPWWIFSSARRVPETRPTDYLSLIKLALARGSNRSVESLLKPGALRERLMGPLAVSALNTPLDSAKSGLMAAVMAETLMLGGRACIPFFPSASLAESLVDPAVRWLRARGAEVSFGRRVAELRIEDGRVQGLRTASGEIAAHRVVLAVPPWVARDLMSGLSAPDRFEAIVNLHFRTEADPPPAIARSRFVGLVGGTAEWVFVKPGHVSVTISAANRLIDVAPETLAKKVWPEAAAALGVAAPLPVWRVVKEKRATFAATAGQDALRPGARSSVTGVALAGDWTATGLPATIEGAIRSGRSAADAILAGV
jgi:squalene-associated FAD-dependent desaturase